MNDKYISIGQLTRYIKYKVDNDPNLDQVFIKGEISNFKAHSRGHYYFTIKDEEARINAVMFATNVKVGQIKTCLGVQGREQDGPREAAIELFNIIKEL